MISSDNYTFDHVKLETRKTQRLPDSTQRKHSFYAKLRCISATLLLCSTTPLARSATRLLRKLVVADRRSATRLRSSYAKLQYISATQCYDTRTRSATRLLRGLVVAVVGDRRSATRLRSSYAVLHGIYAMQFYAESTQ